MCRRWILIFLFLISLPTFAADPAYLQGLIEQAHSKQLAQRTEWHALLHYKPNLLFPGVHSLADDAKFFNAINGKTDPKAELDATLAAFFADVVETDDTQHPQCAFIARYHWLKRELGFDQGHLPQQRCTRFYQWRAQINPQELTLVFASAYLNNPSSMYGHTLLRIDAKGQDERTRLLAYAFNYAAHLGSDSGVAFAIKGLFGGYMGQFSQMPYYLKVREYSDLENRDIWEYRLNFTLDEIERLLMHTWELGPIGFDYYFFDENCAYHLLSLLDVARPSLDLTDKFRWWALPIDTVRAVVEKNGLLKEVIYRPASSTVLRNRILAISDEEFSLVGDLATGDTILTDSRLTALPLQSQARIIETAYELLSYQQSLGKLKDEKYKKLKQDVLVQRSKLDIARNDIPVPAPEVRPDEGHKTSRLALGAGKKDNQEFTEFRIRPTYHDLMDPQHGYTQGAQINFFDLTLRKFENSDNLKVESFILLDIASLSPREQFFDPLSWKINVGAVRKRFSNNNDALVFRVNGGAGFSGKPNKGSLVYVLLESMLEVSNKFSDDYALGAGPSAGVLHDINSKWRMHLFARAQRFALGHLHTSYDLLLEQRYTISKSTALRLTLSRQREFNHYWNAGNLALHYYF